MGMYILLKESVCYIFCGCHIRGARALMERGLYLVGHVEISNAYMYFMVTMRRPKYFKDK